MTLTAAAPVLVGRFTPGSPEWHQARRNGLGGSEVAPMLGLSPYESRFTLWHRKAGVVAPAETTAEMEWGTRLERAVCDKFLDEHPEFVNLDIDDSGTYCHPDRPWQIANPDMVLHTNDGDLYGPTAIFEAKTARYDDEWGEPGTDQIPVHYRCQVLWYLDVFGLDTAHVAVLFGGNDYREYVVHYDADDAALMVRKAREFLDTIEAGTPPDIDGSTSTWETVRELHPDIDGTTLAVPDDLAIPYINATNALKAAENNALEAKAQLVTHMGTAKKAEWNGSPIATRQARDGGRPYIVAARKLPATNPTQETPT